MRTDVHRAVIVEAVMPGIAAELALLPHRQFHRDVRQHERFAPAPAQPAAQVDTASVPRQFEIIIRVTVSDVSRIMSFDTDHAIERNSLRRIEEMIEIRRDPPTMSAKGF